MIASTSLPLVVPDLIFEGQRSGISRFLIPCYLIIQLAVAYLLVTQITSPSITIRQNQLWHFVIMALILAGIVSGIVSSQGKVWWTKYHSYDNVAVASIVNQAAYPLLITKPANGLAFSYLLNSKVQLQLVVPSNIPIIANNYSDIFLYDSGYELQSAFKK